MVHTFSISFLIRPSPPSFRPLRVSHTEVISVCCRERPSLKPNFRMRTLWCVLALSLCLLENAFTHWLGVSNIVGRATMIFFYIFAVDAQESPCVKRWRETSERRSGWWCWLSSFPPHFRKLCCFFTFGNAAERPCDSSCATGLLGKDCLVQRSQAAGASLYG